MAYEVRQARTGEVLAVFSDEAALKTWVQSQDATLLNNDEFTLVKIDEDVVPSPPPDAERAHYASRSFSTPPEDGTS